MEKIEYRVWQAEQMRNQIENNKVYSAESMLRDAMLGSLSFLDTTKKEDLCRMVSKILGIIEDDSFLGAITHTLGQLLKEKMIERTDIGFYKRLK